MSFFSKCVTGAKHTEAAETYFEKQQIDEERRLNMKRIEREASERMAKSMQSMKVPYKTPNMSGWPSNCTICHVGCMNEICNSCLPIFQKGLRVKSPLFEKVTPETVRHRLAAFYTSYGKAPRSIVMNRVTYTRYFLLECEYEQNANRIYFIKGIPVVIDNVCPDDVFVVKA